MITIDRYSEINKMKEALDDCRESISVLSNAIKCGFLEDKHSLTIQEWLKEYEQRESYLETTLEGALNEQRKRT
tara:strand:+ start:140 stop:361 length:222 start_codon:yes stop_codon:yes gene_type:complete